jgi:hypothetical protein
MVQKQISLLFTMIIAFEGKNPSNSGAKKIEESLV